MRRFHRHTRRLTTFIVLAALLFAHSSLAVAACIEHLQASHHEHSAASHQADGHTGDTHHQHGHSLLCQIGCEAQAQSRDYVKAFEIPVPLAEKVYVVVPALVALAWPSIRVQHRGEYFSAAPPPLPLTILLSQFRK